MMSTDHEPVPVEAVVFDLDGVLIDSEPIWDEVRRTFTEEHGGRWRADSQRRMMGMSTAEWSAYLHDELGVQTAPEAIATDVVDEVAARLSEHLPLLDGAVEAVQRLKVRWPLGLASSAARPVIEVALDRAGLTSSFAVVISTEEVARGKPAPDVYLEAARRLGVEPERCAAVEDSSNGLRAAAAAGMRVIAVPNPHYPPDADALARASLVLPSLRQLTIEAIERL